MLSVCEQLVRAKATKTNFRLFDELRLSLLFLHWTVQYFTALMSVRRAGFKVAGGSDKTLIE